MRSLLTCVSPLARARGALREMKTHRHVQHSIEGGGIFAFYFTCEMTHEYDVDTNSADFKQRCTDIHALLTSKKIDEIVRSNRMRVAKSIDDDNKRCVFIVFASTASLLRYARGSNEEKVFNIASVTLAEARKCMPESDLIKSCDGTLHFCCVIATARPVMPNESARSSQLTVHATTRISVTLFDVDRALCGDDDADAPAPAAGGLFSMKSDNFEKIDVEAAIRGTTRAKRSNGVVSTSDATTEWISLVPLLQAAAAAASTTTATTSVSANKP